MVLGLAAGIAAPLILRATGLDKKIEKGIRDTPRNIANVKKQLGFKKGGMVHHTGMAKLHQGEFVLTKAQVDKMKKVAKKVKAKPKPKKSKK